jgi:hypothetical protein
MSFCLMTTVNTDLEKLIGQSFKIDLGEADIARLSVGHTTRWRTMPYFITGVAGF